MISKTENKRIKQILGYHYTSLVQKELELMGALNKNGKPHTGNQIRVVLYGKCSHNIIEDAIFKAVEKRQEEIAARKSILTKKPAAVTADS